MERNVRTLKADVGKLKGKVPSLEMGQRSIMAMLERLSLSLEEEAKEVVGPLLRRRGINVSLSSLTLDDVEFDLFGASDELLILCEATVRLGMK